MIHIGCDLTQNGIISGSVDFVTLNSDEDFNYFLDNNEGERVVVRMAFNFATSSIPNAKRIWKMFWNDAGGYKLQERGILHCIVIPFPTNFEYSERNVRKVRSLCKQIPGDIHCIFDFMHWTWWESENFQNLAKGNDNWCISTTFVENSLVRAGWAGTMPSTRTLSKKEIPPIRGNKFAYVSLYGSMGPYIGSYDENRFLERFASSLMKVKSDNKDVYVNFSNNDSTITYPLLPLSVSGYVCCPKIGRQDIPDSICSIHDSQRLRNILDIQSRSPYNIDHNGYVKVVFM